MKFEVDTTLMLLEGGNKYKVRQLCPTEGAEYRGLYLLECVDFWCEEDLGDGITCERQGQRIWIASYFGDCMKIETSSFYYGV
jgi:hypothetical protein